MGISSDSGESVFKKSRKKAHRFLSPFVFFAGERDLDEADEEEEEDLRTRFLLPVDSRAWKQVYLAVYGNPPSRSAPRLSA